jgi:hypothetical protein
VKIITPVLLTHATCSSLELATTQILDLCTTPCVRKLNYRVLRVFLKQGRFPCQTDVAIRCESSQRFSECRLRAIPRDDSLSPESKSLQPKPAHVLKSPIYGDNCAPTWLNHHGNPNISVVCRSSFYDVESSRQAHQFGNFVASRHVIFHTFEQLPVSRIYLIGAMDVIYAIPIVKFISCRIHQ